MLPRPGERPIFGVSIPNQVETLMDTLLSYLTPEQIAALDSACTTVSEWYDQLVLLLGDLAGSIVIEDVVL